MSKTIEEIYREFKTAINPDRALTLEEQKAKLSELLAIEGAIETLTIANDLIGRAAPELKNPLLQHALDEIKDEEKKALFVNYVTSKDFDTPLIHALSIGDLDIVNTLITAGANPNLPNYIGFSPLTIACATQDINAEQDINIVKALIAAGANPDLEGSQFTTPLFAACSRGNSEIAKLLLDAGANPNFEAQGSAPVIVSASDPRATGATEARGFIESSLCNSPLFVACSRGHSEIAKLLLDERANPNFTTAKMDTPLIMASQDGYASIVGYLLEKGADVHYRNPLNGYTALMVASGGGHLDVVRALLAQGADVNILDSEHRDTPLILASGGGHLDVVRALLARGADVHYRNPLNGYTALTIACLNQNPNIDIVRALLAQGADLNIPNSDGYTALMLASGGGHLDVVITLIDAGADVNIIDSAHRDTALMLASGGGHLDVVSALLAHVEYINRQNSDGNTALMLASGGGHLDVVSALLARGADLNIPNSDGNTALMLASYGGHLDVVSALLAHVEDINTQNSNGYTALMIACANQNPNIDIVKALIAGGAHLNIPNSDGYTALMLACTVGHLDVVSALIDAGADVNILNLKDGYTALTLASSADSLESNFQLATGGDPRLIYSNILLNKKEIMKALIGHNHGIALLNEAHVNSASFISVLSRSDIDIDFEPMMELMQDSFAAKPQLKENQRGQKLETQKFAKSFAKIISSGAILKISPSNALKIISAFEGSAGLDISNNAYTKLGIKFSALENLIKVASNDSANYLELLDLILKNVSDYGYKYAGEIASKILAAGFAGASDLDSAGGGIGEDVISDLQLMVAIREYERASGKSYTKSLEVLKQEISSLDSSEEIIYDQANIPAVVKILKGFSAPLAENAAGYLAKYQRAEELQQKLADAKILFAEISLLSNQASQSKKPTKKSPAKAKAEKPSDVTEKIEDIEKICSEIALAKKDGVLLLGEGDFLKGVLQLQKKFSSLNHHGLIKDEEGVASSISAEESFDGSFSLANLIKYSKSKDVSFKHSVKESFEKPEKKLDAKSQAKFIHKFEIAVLQSQSIGEISPEDANSLYRLKAKLPISFLKAYLENTIDGVLKAIDDKFADIDDRTTISGRTYATSVRGGSSVAGEDDREEEDFVADELEAIAEGEEGDSDGDRDSSSRSLELPETLAKTHIRTLGKIKDKQSTLKDDLESLAGEFPGILEYENTKNGWVLKHIPTGETVGSHRDHAQRDKFKSKSGDGGKAADLFKFFDKIGFFAKYLATEEGSLEDYHSGSSDRESGHGDCVEEEYHFVRPDIDPTTGMPRVLGDTFAPFDEVDGM